MSDDELKVVPHVSSKKVRGPRSHSWVFTSFNDRPPEFSHFFRYLVYQIEKCPTTGTLHFQGYAEFVDDQTLNSAKKLIGDPKAHLEIRKGTQQQAIDYCKKSETALPDSCCEFGKPARPGTRTDLDNMWEMARQGHTSLEMLYEFRGNGFRHLGLYERAQKALFGHDYGTIDAQLLINRALGNPPGKKPDYGLSSLGDDLRRLHVDELNDSHYNAQQIAFLEAAAEVSGNTVKPDTINK